MPVAIWYYLYSLGPPVDAMATAPWFVGTFVFLCLGAFVGLTLLYVEEAQRHFPEVTTDALRYPGRNILSRQPIREIRWSQIASLDVGLQSTGPRPGGTLIHWIYIRLVLEDGRRVKLKFVRMRDNSRTNLDDLASLALSARKSARGAAQAK